MNPLSTTSDFFSAPHESAVVATAMAIILAAWLLINWSRKYVWSNCSSTSASFQYSTWQLSNIRNWIGTLGCTYTQIMWHCSNGCHSCEHCRLSPFWRYLHVYSLTLFAGMLLHKNNSSFLFAGEPIPADHGYPLRVIIPGVVGARNVKWLKKIVLSDEESKSHWQRKDYKCFNPSIEMGSSDFGESVDIVYCDYQLVRKWSRS